jgi:hypothetical protein
MKIHDKWKVFKPIFKKEHFAKRYEKCWAAVIDQREKYFFIKVLIKTIWSIINSD